MRPRARPVEEGQMRTSPHMQSPSPRGPALRQDEAMCVALPPEPPDAGGDNNAGGRAADPVWAASGSQGGAVRVWSLQSGSAVQSLPHSHWASPTVAVCAPHLDSGGLKTALECAGHGARHRAGAAAAVGRSGRARGRLPAERLLRRPVHALARHGERGFRRKPAPRNLLTRVTQALRPRGRSLSHWLCQAPLLCCGHCPRRLVRR